MGSGDTQALDLAEVGTFVEIFDFCAVKWAEAYLFLPSLSRKGKKSSQSL